MKYLESRPLNFNKRMTRRTAMPYILILLFGEM